MTLGVYGRTREERLYHVVEQVATVLQGETQRGASVHRRDTAENKRAVNASALSIYSSLQPVEAAGIEPATSALSFSSMSCEICALALCPTLSPAASDTDVTRMVCATRSTAFHRVIQFS